jgi:hypothetical protein
MGRTGFSGRRSTVREPRIHGSGAAERASQLSLMPAPAPSRHDCSRRELRPNPIDTRTPLVAPFECLAAGVAVTHIEWARAPSKISSVTPRDRLRGGSWSGEHFRTRQMRAASRTPSRKGMRSAAPEVPSFEGPPLREVPFPQLVTNLWSGARAFSISTPCRARTVRRGCGDSALSPPGVDLSPSGRATHSRKNE